MKKHQERAGALETLCTSLSYLIRGLLMSYASGKEGEIEVLSSIKNTSGLLLVFEDNSVCKKRYQLLLSHALTPWGKIFVTIKNTRGAGV